MSENRNQNTSAASGETGATAQTAGDPHRRLKDAFGRFSTGVGIAACYHGKDEPAAITINSFSSVSLEPPLVLWCIDRDASSFGAFMASDSYAVSILRADQQSIANRYAGYPDPETVPPRFKTGTSGAPVLTDALAWFDCRIWARYEAGDHVILVGEIIDFAAGSGAPLTYFASRFGVGPTV